MYLLLRAVFPLLSLLYLTDSDILGMDKLCYLTSITIAAVEKSKDSLRDKVLFPDSTRSNIFLWMILSAVIPNQTLTRGKTMTLMTRTKKERQVSLKMKIKTKVYTEN